MIVDGESLLSTLETATGLAGVEHDAGRVTVKFEHGVESAERATMWEEPSGYYLGLWAAELKPQYERVYNNPRVIESLTALEDSGWVLRANFHLAFHNSHWKQRWYPSNRMPVEDYLHQWATDLPNAGRFSRYEVENPNYIRWLVERGYITESEVSGLIIWLRGLTRQQVDVRPSIALEMSWGDLPSPTDVRDAINDVLVALDEPRLGEQRAPVTRTARKAAAPKAAGAKPAATKTAAAKAAKPKKPVPIADRPVTPCPNCFVALPATGICDCGYPDL